MGIYRLYHRITSDFLRLIGIVLHKVPSTTARSSPVNMVHLLLLITLLPAFLYAAMVDPSTICEPDMYEFNIYDTKTGFTAYAAMDIVKGVMAINYVGGALIRDSKDMKAYTYVETLQSCLVTQLAPKDALMKCLPANATLDSKATLGYGTGTTDVQIWAGVRPGSPAKMAIQGPLDNGRYIPVMYQKDPDSMLIYSNINMTVADQLCSTYD